MTTTLLREELIELVKLTEQWGSERDSRFYLYEPNPMMRHFHASKSKIRCLLGGNRSGKTTALVVEFVSRFLGEPPPSLKNLMPSWRLNPASRMRLCMIDYPNSFEKVIYPLFRSFLPQSAIKSTVKEQGRIKSIWNYHGGFIEFMQYEQDVSKFQGASRDLIGYDEEPPENIRDENQMRLIDTDGEEVFFLTPVAEENTAGYMPSLWIYDKLFSKANKIYEIKDGKLSITSSPKPDVDTEVFFASIFDNKYLSRDAIDRILSKFSKQEFRTRAFGYFTFMSGRVYDCFSETTHLIKPFDWLSDDYTLYIAIDPHPRTPHAVLFGVVDKHDTLYIVDELFEEFVSVESFVSAIKAKMQGKPAELIIIDPSAFIRNPSDNRCFAFDLADAGLEPVPIKAAKDLSRGIIVTKKYFNEKRLFVTENCARFRHEIMHYRWSNWSKNTGNTKELKQVPVDKDDHMMENLYRLCLLHPRYVNMQELELAEQWS